MTARRPCGSLAVIGQHVAFVGPDATDAEVNRLAGENSDTLRTIISNYIGAEAVLETVSDPSELHPDTLDYLFRCFDTIGEEADNMLDVDETDLLWKAVKYDYQCKVVSTFDDVRKTLDKKTDLYRLLRKCCDAAAGGKAMFDKETVAHWELGLLPDSTRHRDTGPKFTAVLQGIQNSPELNGREVEIVEFVVAGDRAEQRVTVRPTTGDRTSIKVKMDKLRFSSGAAPLDFKVYEYKCSLARLQDAGRTEKADILLTDVKPTLEGCRGLLLQLTCPADECEGGSECSVLSPEELLLSLIRDYARAIESTAAAIVSCFHDGLGKTALYPRGGGIEPTSCELNRRKKELLLVLHTDKLTQLNVPPFNDEELPKIFADVQHIISNVFSGVSSSYLAGMSKGREFAEAARMFDKIGRHCQQQNDGTGERAATTHKLSNARRAVDELRNAMLILDGQAPDNIERARVRVDIAKMCKLQNLGMQATLYLMGALRVMRVHANMRSPESMQVMAEIQGESDSSGEQNSTDPHASVAEARSDIVVPRMQPSDCRTVASPVQVDQLTERLECQALQATVSPTWSWKDTAHEQKRSKEREVGALVPLSLGSAWTGVALFGLTVAPEGAAAAVSGATPAVAAAVTGAAATGVTVISSVLGVLAAGLFLRSFYLRFVTVRGLQQGQQALIDRMYKVVSDYEEGNVSGQDMLESLAAPFTSGDLEGKSILKYPVKEDIISDVEESFGFLLEYGVPPSGIMTVFCIVAQVLTSCQVSTMTIDGEPKVPTRLDMRHAGLKLYRTLIDAASEQPGEKTRILWDKAKKIDSITQNDNKLCNQDIHVSLKLRKSEFNLITDFMHDVPRYLSIESGVRVWRQPPKIIMEYNESLNESHFRRSRFVDKMQLGSEETMHSCSSYSMDDLIALMNQQEEVTEVQIILTHTNTTGAWEWLTAAGSAAFGIYRSVTVDGAEMINVRRQRWLARLGLGVVLLTQAASLGDGRNEGEVQEAERNLQEVVTELRKVSDGQDEEVEAKLQAVDDFFAALVGRQLVAIEDNVKSAEPVALAVTDTDKGCLCEDIVELWRGSDDFDTLNLAVQFSGLKDQCFTKDTFYAALDKHRGSSAYEKYAQAQPDVVARACSSSYSGEPDLNIDAAIFLVEISSWTVCLWELSDNGALMTQSSYGSNNEDEVVHLFIDTNKYLLAVKCLGYGEQGASRLLASLKSGKYGRIKVKPQEAVQFLDALEARAKSCEEENQRKTETSQCWVANEIGWLQCVVGFMKLPCCPEMRPEPIMKLLRLLAANGQHRCILNDIVPSQTFLLKFDSKTSRELCLWRSYSQLCIGQRAMAKATAKATAKCDTVRRLTTSVSGTLDSFNWGERISAACDRKQLDFKGSSVPGKDVKHILSIDGGGMRGILPAQFLVEIESRLHFPIARLFPVMAGVSTGSIICTGLALPESLPVGVTTLPKYSAEDVLRQFMCGNVFQGKRYLPTPSLYDVAPLEQLLDKLCGQALYKDLISNVVVPAVRERQTEVHLFTRRSAELAHRELRVFDAVRSSSAAPGYFPAHRFSFRGESCCFVDGGLKANNPSSLALDHALEIFPDTKVSVLSLGTGAFGVHPEVGRDAFWWGFSTGAAGLMSEICSTSSDVHRDMEIRCRHLDRCQQYLRWSPNLPMPVDLADDSAATTDALLEVAKTSIDEAYAAEDNWFNKLLESLAVS